MTVRGMTSTRLKRVIIGMLIGVFFTWLWLTTSLIAPILMPDDGRRMGVQSAASRMIAQCVILA